MATVGILGGGIAGLTAAYELHQQGLDVIVFEASASTGGKIQTEQTEGYVVEHGPNSLQASTPLLRRLTERLGLEEERMDAQSAAKKRYVVRDGKPVSIPMSPVQLVRTPLFSFSGKLRLLAEPFIRSHNDIGNESLGAFIRRRFGEEALDYGINPFVAGVFAGDPDRLAVRHAFPRLAEWDQTHGSVLLGALFSDSDDESERGIFSFRDGLQTLPDALTVRLGQCIHCHASVQSIRFEGTRWIVETESGVSAGDRFAADALISTIPLFRFADLDFDTPVDRSIFEAVPYPPVSVLALGFPREAVDHPLDGFGMLVPEVESDIDILGTLFSSSIFPNRAPDGHVLLTTFVGGMRRPELGRAAPPQIEEVVCRDLETLLGVDAEPSFRRLVRWHRAIPQYTLRHQQVQSRIRELEDRHPRLFLAGNYRSGISVGDAMDSGAEAAERAYDALERASA